MRVVVDVLAIVPAYDERNPSRTDQQVCTVRPAGKQLAPQDLGDGLSLLRMSADSFDWPAMAFGAIGAEFEVVSPAEVIDHVRDWAERFGGATAAEPGRQSVDVRKGGGGQRTVGQPGPPRARASSSLFAEKIDAVPADRRAPKLRVKSRGRSTS